MTYPDTQAPSDASQAAIRAARRWAQFYWSRGYRPLPSRPEKKRPYCRFAEWWEGGGPDPAMLWDRFPTPNIQVMTGRHWRLAVIDLDGPEAIEEWQTFGPGPLPRTWESTSGGGGRHLWYTLPDGLPDMPKRLIWKGEGDHRAIELLCDRSLITAPPSIHARTGRVYRFRAGCSPREMVRPAMMPRWILGLPSVSTPKPVVAPPAQVARPDRKVLSGPLPNWITRQEVLAAIHDKAALAASWGLRFAARLCESNGWVSVHDYNREDSDPSARFHSEMGRFWRPGEKTISLFDLGVELGVYADWRACCADLASIYLPRN